MRLLLSLILIACCYISSVGMPLDADYTSEDSITICRLLKTQDSNLKSQNSALYFARQFIGVPYVAYTLEKNNRERLVVNTRQLDCTTLVETVTALTICHNRGLTKFSDYCSVLKQIRYRNGKLNGYVSRLHYFTDWILDNEAMGLVETCPLTGLATAKQTINIGYMTTHPESYKALKAHPEWVKEVAKTEKAINGKTFKYIPKDKIPNTKAARAVIKDGDIIAITCKKAGLDIAHVGFAVWHKDGLHLLNASSIHKKVVEEPMALAQYLSKHSSHTGIRVVRISMSSQ